MRELIDSIISSEPGELPDGVVLGRSREDRTIMGYAFGSGGFRISLLGGCHADEPAGPRLLRNLCRFLGAVDRNNRLLTRYEWWIVPHINPDGEHRNRTWYSDSDASFDLMRYLSGVEREAPGDDIEFGFPPGDDDPGARPENRSVYAWWSSDRMPFDLHVSLHGMGFSGGPWFLIDEAWRERSTWLVSTCSEEVERRGYRLHDVERNGEKGFFRIARGFSTRPDSRYMRAYFEAQGDYDTARLFRPSSMETMRNLGGDPLTLVTEMPLFVLPGVGVELGPPDPVAVAWKAKIAEWRTRMEEEERHSNSVRREIEESGIQPMPVRDQMHFQWTLITAGIRQVEMELNGVDR